jgi:hypothetical protein
MSAERLAVEDGRRDDREAAGRIDEDVASPELGQGVCSPDVQYLVMQGIQ